MKKLISFIFILYLLIFPFSIIKTIEQPSPEVIAKIKTVIPQTINYSVSLLSNDGLCSGVIIKNTPKESIVLTAKHCVHDLEGFYVNGIPVNDYGVSKNDDLAWLKINQEIPDKTYAPISLIKPKNDDIIIMTSYPSLVLDIQVGIIAYSTPDWTFAVLDIVHGCSGSGIFNTDGELIGVVWGGLAKKDQEPMPIAIFERWEDIVKFIKDNNLL